MGITRRARAGFSAFELGLCFLAIAIGYMFLLFAGRYGMDRARDASCGSNLKQVALAMQMYAVDYGGRGPHEAPVTGLYPYVKNQQIFVCPANWDAPEVTVLIPHTHGGYYGPGPSPPDWDQQPGEPTQLRLGYQFRLDTWNDEPPQTIIVQDIAPDVHTSRTWLGARWDGGVHRYPAAQWKSLK